MKRILACSIVVAFIITACGDTDKEDSSGDAGRDDQGESGLPLDWWTSTCGDLGGVETPAGACFIGCESTDDCPADLVCWNSGVWFTGFCTVRDDVMDEKGCGPKGWYTRSYGCYMICPAEGADDQCPAGFRCIADSSESGEYFCTGYSGSSGSDCNVPCPSGCCSPTGYSCCEPPFCSGICVGSSCC